MVCDPAGVEKGEWLKERKELLMKMDEVLAGTDAAAGRYYEGPAGTDASPSTVSLSLFSACVLLSPYGRTSFAPVTNAYAACKSGCCRCFGRL